MDKSYDPKKVEGRIYKKWERSGAFKPVTPSKSPTFSIAMAPPNITGSLHIGHALEYTTSDILVRYKRMRGYKTLWIPGTDHAGIATQNVVEKQLKKKGLSRHDLGREKFLEEVWKWKKNYGDIIVGQLKKLGVSADWSRLRFTMDKDYQKAVEEAFLHYYKKGWIYRGERVVSWCVKCQTSLSDLELEYKEEKGKLWFIKYPVVGSKKFIIVATTRPETMLGDTAVAVNPKDKRYKNLVGKKVLLPLQDREIPIVQDRRIDLGFGTGAVKVTPAHDMLDEQIGLDNNLPAIQVIDERGRMTETAGAPFAGMKVLEAREAVVKELEKKGLIKKIEDYTHNVAKCYRCDGTVEPLRSRQWFLKMSEGLADSAIKAVKSGKVKFHPKRWEKIYFDWLKNTKDWTISRQIWWGHQLPVFFCEKKLEELQVTNLKFKVAIKKPKKCPFCKKCEMQQSTDVLDTWFSSALWPFAILGWPKKTKDLREFYPTSANTNDRGIINLWDGRMIFSGLEFMGEAPFKDNIIHATILTKEGKRMSKSLGTGIDPLELIEECGADATRFGVIWQAMGGQDIRWDGAAVIAGRKFANKVWNATRFVLGTSGVPEDTRCPNLKKLQSYEKKILSQLNKTKKEMEKDIENYQFGQALRKFYDFFWHNFCDKCLEESKKHPDKETDKVLLYVLSESLKILHPFMPFITEEIYGKIHKKALITEKW